jgi:hypothetical protein
VQAAHVLSTELMNMTIDQHVELLRLSSSENREDERIYTREDFGNSNKVSLSTSCQEAPPLTELQRLEVFISNDGRILLALGQSHWGYGGVPLSWYQEIKRRWRLISTIFTVLLLFVCFTFLCFRFASPGLLNSNKVKLLLPSALTQTHAKAL